VGGLKKNIMPLDPATGALIGTGIGALMQIGTNRKNRQFAKEMYGRQRSDALADWHRQNTYNSPVETRKRMEAAGLNPALMYGGNQTGGMSGAVRTSSVSQGNAQAPKVSLLEYASLKKLGEETNILKEQARALKYANDLEEAKMKGGYGTGDMRAEMWIRSVATDVAKKSADQQYSQSAKEYIQRKTDQVNEIIKQLDRENKLPEGTFRSDNIIERKASKAIDQFLKGQLSEAELVRLLPLLLTKK
jgi:hypothetical protein